MNDEWDWHQFSDTGIWEFADCVHWRVRQIELTSMTFAVPVVQATISIAHLVRALREHLEREEGKT